MQTATMLLILVKGLKNVNMNFNYEDQVTDVTKRLEADEVSIVNILHKWFNITK